MRLLHVPFLTFETFYNDTPAYCILSHRWEDEEVSYVDMISGRDLSHLKGYQKIRNAALIAEHEGLSYIWIDTCCIDKSNHSELAEAILSMFRWYAQSSKCVAYLSDIDSQDEITKSLWFTRGWTLQELLAPSEVYFYDQHWELRGERQDFVHAIEQTTGIAIEYLQGAAAVIDAPVCQKMFWASSRVTTRPEDMAYSLMGLFDVNIPNAYGEGAERAFRRLQEGILNVSPDDETIFAWTAEPEECEKKPYWGLLAPSPAYFKKSGKYRPSEFHISGIEGTIEIINDKTVLPLTLRQWDDDPSESLFLGIVNCVVSDVNAHTGESIFAIILQKMSDISDLYARVRPDLIQMATPSMDLYRFGFKEKHVPRLMIRSQPRREYAASGFAFILGHWTDIQYLRSSADGLAVFPARVRSTTEECPGWETALRSQKAIRYTDFRDLVRAGHLDSTLRSNTPARVVVATLRLQFSIWDNPGDIGATRKEIFNAPTSKQGHLGMFLLIVKVPTVTTLTYPRSETACRWLRDLAREPLLYTFSLYTPVVHFHGHPEHFWAG